VQLVQVVDCPELNEKGAAKIALKAKTKTVEKSRALEEKLFICFDCGNTG
jgi:hypothetical protein